MEPKTTIKTLIVDDSKSMRQLIRLSLSKHNDIVVVAEAENAREARDAVNRFRPDVMTLDVEMPDIDGLEFLARLMRARPMPVVMVSSLTEQGSEAAIKALSLGAVECIAKQKRDGENDAFFGLGDALRMAATARVRQTTPRVKAQPRGLLKEEPSLWNGRYVVIGASTGGVEALETILSRFPKNCPPTLITQHMPEMFLKNFAARLNGLCAPEIRLGRDGDTATRGLVLIAPGGETHMTLSDHDPSHVRMVKGPKHSGHRPSIDLLFASTQAYAAKMIAVLLTGMGHDGAEGMRTLRRQGGYCIAQDRDSSIVYGMPRVACEKGGVDISLPLSEIADKILQETLESASKHQKTSGGANAVQP